MVALWQKLLLRRRETEHLYEPTPSKIPLKTTNNFSSNTITYNNPHRQRREGQENVEWEWVTRLFVCSCVAPTFSFDWNKVVPDWLTPLLQSGNAFQRVPHQYISYELPGTRLGCVPLSILLRTGNDIGVTCFVHVICCLRSSNHTPFLLFVGGT